MNDQYDAIIIGAGLSGLAAAHYLKKLAPRYNIINLEKETRPGGAVSSFQDQGFLAEWGPHGFLNNTDESQEILDDTGLSAKAQLAPLGNFVRFVCHRGKLVQLPQNPKQLLSTPLLSLGSKLRILGDLFVKPDAADQTIGSWAARRFGRGVLHLIDAAVSGTFAGDFERLSINAVMPGLRELEIDTGSVLKGLAKKKKLAGPSTKRLPAMVSFPNGMEELVQTLAQQTKIIFGAPVTALQFSGGKWEVTCGEQKYTAANVICALPVNQALSLFSNLDTPPVKNIPVAHIVNVVMGFSDKAKVPFGFGYLAPEIEKRFTMGVMFSTHMFPGRSPGDNILIEALVGGRRHPERLELNDNELIHKVYDDISKLMELPEKPWFVKVLRPQSGIPQLEMDHPAMLDWRRQLSNKYTGLHICGFGWDGIGMNDMTKSAKKAALAVVAGNDKVHDETKIKPVYF